MAIRYDPTEYQMQALNRLESDPNYTIQTEDGDAARGIAVNRVVKCELEHRDTKQKWGTPGYGDDHNQALSEAIKNADVMNKPLTTPQMRDELETARVREQQLRAELAQARGELESAPTASANGESKPSKNTKNPPSA